jgi:hypothetical protein
MIHRDPRCVFVAHTMGLAVVTATWLTNNGIPAQVMDLMTLGGFEGLTAMAPGISARGLEVWVENPAQVEEARALLAEHEAAQARRAAAAQERDPVEVVCEECGKRSRFPGSQFGTIQDCPHCGAYLDVEDAAPSAREPGAAQEPDQPKSP